MLKRSLIIILFSVCGLVWADQPSSDTALQKQTDSSSPIQRLEPPFWWAGMQNPNLQLLVYGDGIADLEVSTSYSGVTVKGTQTLANTNYLFVDLELAKDVQAGEVSLIFSRDGETITTHQYPLLAREAGSGERQGFSAKDAIYLITPDRFANGDPENDEVEGMLEGIDRSKPYGRHGGDVQGITQNIDYLHDLGITQMWLSPVLENNMQEFSYHGYSITDMYKVDERFGGNDGYLELSRAAREKGMGLIMDTIPNHIGLNHWWMKDLPSEDWVNNKGEFMQTSHVHEMMQDPYASESDRREFTDGWFVDTMPDLNQRNQLMADYVIQNNIWWIEYANLTGLRVDTYPYADKEFMTEFVRRIMHEYPNFNIVGEIWRVEASPQAMLAYYQKGNINHDGFVPELPSMMDFPLHKAVVEGLVNEDSQRGMMDIYLTLAADYLLPDPNNMVVIADNHDMDRIHTWMNEDYDAFRMAMAFFLTTRGAPQIYYGTEILVANKLRGDHGDIRSDIPGGWEGDKVNVFTGEGLSKQQQAALSYIKTLLNWRKKATAVHSGKLTHFVPREGVYVYFRYDDQQKVMVVMNNNDAKTKLDLARFADHIGDASKATDIISKKSVNLAKPLKLDAKSVQILEL